MAGVRSRWVEIVALAGLAAWLLGVTKRLQHFSHFCFGHTCALSCARHFWISFPCENVFGMKAPKIFSSEFNLSRWVATASKYLHRKFDVQHVSSKCLSKERLFIKRVVGQDLQRRKCQPRFWWPVTVPQAAPVGNLVFRHQPGTHRHPARPRLAG